MIMFIYIYIKVEQKCLSSANQMTGFYVECNAGVKCVKARKLYIRRNNNKIDSIETGRIVIAHLLP